MTAEASLQWAVRARAWLRAAVLLEGLAAGLALVWWLRQPAPEVPTIRPALPSRELLQAGAAVAVVLPEGLFPKPAPPPSKPKASAATVAVETAASWKVMGTDQGPPPAALLKEVKEGGTAVWVKVGDRLGLLTVKAIAPGRVIVEGPEGEFEIRL